MKKNVNGVEVEMTPSEIAEYNARQSLWIAQTAERIKSEFTHALEELINETAAQKSYSSGVSCASYSGSTNSQWSSEASAFISWRDNAYKYAYDYLFKAESGEITNPILEDFIAGVPTMVWPSTN